jgi:hypothetical protein
VPTTIRSDRKWHDFKTRDEVPAKILASQFDYQDADEVYDGFMLYRGTWYHLDQFMRLDNLSPDSPFKGWEASAGDSYFSGIVIKVSQAGEQYQIGTYLSR